MREGGNGARGRGRAILKEVCSLGGDGGGGLRGFRGFAFTDKNRVTTAANKKETYKEHRGQYRQAEDQVDRVRFGVAIVEDREQRVSRRHRRGKAVVCHCPVCGFVLWRKFQP